MKNRNKKMFALLLAVSMSVGCLAGCGNNEKVSSAETKQTESSVEQTTASAETEEKSLFNVGELPIVNEPVTLKVLTQDSVKTQYSSAADAGYWKWLEEQTGIHFEVESYSADELKNKLPLIMASPDQMPDLFIRCDFTEADVMNYGNGGQLLKLNDLIDEYGTNIKKMYEENPTALGASVIADGSIYSLPAMNGAPSVVIHAINTRFLENSGVEKIPTTLEELKDAMLVMRTKDANGDGIVGNEVLWCDELKTFKRQVLSMVGIACYWPWQGCIFDDHDGEVYFAPTSEEYKYLLGVLNELYAAGCIDQEIFTQSADQVKAKFFDDLTFMGSRADNPETSGFTGMTGWTYVEPVTSAVHDKGFYVLGSDYQVSIGSVSAFTEYPEICTLVLDYMYSKEASIASKFGLEGVDYTVETEEPWVIKSISKDFALGNGYTPILTPRWVTNEMIQPQTTTLTQRKADMYTNHGRFGWQNYVHLTQEQTDQISVLGTDLGLYCDDYFVGFVTGSYDLEKDWDAYVKECESMGVAELTKIYQDAYNVFFGLE
ncbi:MAG: extracellular solute-binding protein [Lachnospiraceae bacterium]|nr:extracellular solute-binding protein [Lachnospiraceae bacterium]